MFEDLTALAERSVMERAVLLVNHVIRAEPLAMARLAGHSGKTVALEFAHWPVLLPALPSTAFVITPAGLVEWLERPGDAIGERPAALTIEVDAANPLTLVAAFATGGRPTVAVAGDPAFADDVRWLIDNLRWDVEDDLARAIGAGPARAVAAFAAAAAKALRDATGAFRGVVDRVDPFGAGAGGGSDGDRSSGPGGR